MRVCWPENPPGNFGPYGTENDPLRLPENVGEEAF
jgi:hypothetical protein